MDFIPYGRQSISDTDIEAVVATLRSDWLTTGPMVPKFEEALARAAGTKYAVAVSSGTAALHCAAHAAGFTEGDEVIVPSLTFAASANALLYVGAKPVFADVKRDDLLIDPQDVRRKIGPNTKGILAVDYAGQPCDYESLLEIAQEHELTLVADACHSIGGSRAGSPMGSFANLSCFSFHPVKHITTAEGGAIVTNNEQLATRMRTFRNHGISTDHRQRAEQGKLHYEMVELGYNYRLNDVQCALGLSQINRLGAWVQRRNEIASLYNELFAGSPYVESLTTHQDNVNAHHLFVVRLNLENMRHSRDEIFQKMRKVGIGVNCHYPPVHLHPYYKARFGTTEGLLPNTEWAYERILSLPMFADLSNPQVTRVAQALLQAVSS